MLNPAKPIDMAKLRRFVQDCLSQHTVIYSAHARSRMASRVVSLDDVHRVLTGGRYAISDYRAEFAAWSYTAEAQGVRIVFAVTLDEAGNALIVISTVRIK